MKGFRDFYPEDWRVLRYIFEKWREVSLKYGYEEIEGPILEDAELYQKSGQEIPEQMYNFVDKSGKLVALRPETTPSVARMIKGKTLGSPVKWFSVSRCFRYERPQSGRLRSFFQFNLDCAGSSDLRSDAEVIVAAIRIMEAFDLSEKDFYIRVSNRKLVNEVLQKLDLINKGEEVSRLIDKYDKIGPKNFKLSLKDLGLEEDQIKGLLRYMKAKSLDELKDEGFKEGYDELKTLFELFKAYKVDKYCKLDLGIVRGFDYYTGTVFEVFDVEKKLRAIAGGGRYDDLADKSAVGFGMGDVVLSLMLKAKKKLPDFSKEIDYYVAPVSDDVALDAIKIGEKLRKKYNVEIDVVGKNLGKQLNYASSLGVANVIIVGKKDLEKKEVTVRDMKKGKEKKIKIKELS